jgi:hypothetical protein
MSGWLPIDTAPTDGSTVMLAFSGQVEAGYFDDGTDCDGEVVEQPSWYWFDQHDTGPCLPLYWQPYPAAPDFAPTSAQVPA